jgi:phosphate starvation-inducible protein PhoH and related proteins
MKKSRKNSKVESQSLRILHDLTVDPIVRPPRVQHIQPKNDKQQDLLNAIKAYPITVTIGCAGTGKTYCSTSMVASLYLSGKYNKIILTRANVPTGRSLGAFPGTIQEKMAPWLLPITNVLERYFGESFYQYLCRKQTIEIQPLETIRGRSYENSLVIVDEAQNLNFEELKAITTRLGENSKMVLTGDPQQSDSNNGKDILKFVSLCEKHGIHIPIIKFNSDDIVRSDIVGQLVKMFEKEGL